MQEYAVNIGGLEHTLLLSDEDAKRLDVKPATKAADAPANKARTSSNKKG